MKTLAEVAHQLRSTKAPWVAVLAAEKWASLQELLSKDPDLRIVEIDGRDARTKSALLAQLGARLCFPEYFGRNWDALDECVRDLAWMPARGYVLAVTNADELLSDDRRDYETFISLMRTAGAEWATPRTSGAFGTPFHVILLVPDNWQDSKRWSAPELLGASA